MTLALTADEAFDLYKTALDEDRLVQGSWRTEEEGGRTLVCALSALDPNITSASECPASVMPRWLAQNVVWLFDEQPREAALPWGLALYGELKRLGGVVPFSVVYEWQAEYSVPLAIEAAEKRGVDPAPHLARQALHRRAMKGDRAPRTEWYEALKSSYRLRYLNADAYAYADADAYAYANANADADADAYAYANADADAKQRIARRAEATKRLADGLITALRNVASPVAGAPGDAYGEPKF